MSNFELFWGICRPIKIGDGIKTIKTKAEQLKKHSVLYQIGGGRSNVDCACINVM